MLKTELTFESPRSCQSTQSKAQRQYGHGVGNAFVLQIVNEDTLWTVR